MKSIIWKNFKLLLYNISCQTIGRAIFQIKFSVQRSLEGLSL